MRASGTNSLVPAWVATLALLAAGALGVGPAPTEEAKLSASDGAPNDNLGISAAVDGDTAVVGANARDGARGAAYVFTRSAGVWTEQATLTAVDATPDDFFGGAVGFSQDTALVGARTKDEYRGAAYVFRRIGTFWGQETKLAPADAAPDDGFGCSVAIDGDTAVVGAFGKNQGQGAAYVFTRAGTAWTQQAKLVSDDAGITDNFGRAVALAGDTAVIGAPQHALSRGAAYVFTRSGTTWTQAAKLEGSLTLSNDNLGSSVACTDDVAVAATPYQNRGHGAVYVFARSGAAWPEQARLLAADAAENDLFGISVGCGPGVVIAGAYLKNSGRGAAYLFERAGTAWTQSAKLTPSDSVPDDYFGWSVALAQDTAVVGSFFHAGRRGAAYVFRLPAPSGCVLATKVKAKPNAKHPERSTLTASGTLDTGSAPADFSGAATFDAGGFRLSVPAFTVKGKSLVHADAGFALSITPTTNASSRATFSVKVTGDLSGKVAMDGPLPLRFTNAFHDLAGTATLTKGTLGPHGVTEPSLAVLSASATLKGGGRDSLKLTLSFATDGVAPALGERDVTIGFGDAYLSAVLPGASFVSRRNTSVFAAKAPGITKVTIDYTKGTITIAGAGLDLGEFADGGNDVAVTITRGTDTRTAGIRMARSGTKLTY